MRAAYSRPEIVRSKYKTLGKVGRKISRASSNLVLTTNVVRVHSLIEVMVSRSCGFEPHTKKLGW